MGGKNITFAIVLDPPRVYSDYDVNPKPGFYIEIIQMCCQYLKAYCTLSNASNGDYGSYSYVNGTWSGMIGDIMNGLYDISVPGTTITEERAAVVDYSNTVFVWDLLLVSRNDRSTTTFSLVDTLIFNWSVWLCLMAICAVIGIVIAVAQTSKFDKKLCFNCLSECISSFSVISSQSDASTITRTSLRFLLSFWGLSVVIVTGIYSSHLVVETITNTNRLPFKDLESFAACVEQSKCRLVYHGKGRRPYQLVFSGNSTLQKAVKSNPILMTKSFNETFSVIFNDKNFYYATIVYTDEFLANTNANKGCSFRYIKIGTDAAGFPMVKNYSHKKTINEFVSRIRPSGILTKLRNNYVGSEQPCFDNSHGRTVNDQLTPLDIYKFFGCLCILMLGCSIGFGAFILEVFKETLRKYIFCFVSLSHLNKIEITKL